jgi:hypothetical protein
MRKMFLIVAASGAVMALTPATALARHHGRHGHHVRVHHKKFGSDQTSTTTTPTATVASFDPTTNMLTISANGGSVSGTVTPDTRLVCISPQPTGMEPTGEDQGHDHGGDGGGGNWGGDGGGGNWGGDDQGQGDDDMNQSCTTANLVATTPVQFADLSISGAGMNWDVVVLVTQPSTVPTVPDTDNDGD